MDDSPPIPEPMDVSVLVDMHFAEVENAFLSGHHLRKVNLQNRGEDVWFPVHLFGTQVWQSVKAREVCEINSTVLDHEGLKQAIVKEFAQLTSLEVGDFVSGDDARKIAESAGIRIIATRWVLVQKPDKVRARLVCKDFRSNGLTSIREDIYSPTSNLESLRLLVSFAEQFQLSIYGADVSTAFLYSPLDSVEIVSLPTSTVSSSGLRLYVKLKKALYGLRRAPLAWYRALRNAVLNMGMQATSEPTLFRSKEIYLLIYVDDLLIVGYEKQCKEMISKLQEQFEVKQTGALPPNTAGEITFLGRSIFREGFGKPLKLGLPPSYFDGIEETAGFSVKLAKGPPNLNKYVKEQGEEETFLSAEASSQYRSILGRLAWFSLTVPPLAYNVSWLSCYQQKPTEDAERALHDVLRFAKLFRAFSQNFRHEGGSSWSPDMNEIRIIVDASWGLRSTMGGVIMYNQTFHKVWSRRISTVCLSSAESEVHAIAEGIKEALSFSVIFETLLNGLPKKDSVGIFVQTGTSLPLVCFSDSEAGIHISNMSGLLRKVRHLQLRALLVQQMVQEERLVMRFVSGEDSPSDFLTKCSDSWHLSLLIYLLGIEH